MSKQTSFKRRISLFLAVAMLLCLLPITAVAAPIGANEGKKDLAVYFPNWGKYNDVHQQQLVTDLPWDRLTTINHAFFEIVPDAAHADASTSAWKPAAEGEVPFGIRTTDPGDLVPDENGYCHFDAYAEMSAQYPDVAIMISVGGWTRTGLFSTVAASAEKRAIFIQSCIDLMNTYPWIAGIDIDWEYPGVARSGDASDRGNEVNPNDGVNYTTLLTEMRAAFDTEFGTGANRKQLTVCAPANATAIDPTLPDPRGRLEAAPEGTPVNQELGNIAAVVDRINLMTYDFTGSYDATTGHQANLFTAGSAVFSTKDAVDYYLANGVPAEKLNIGSPLYSRGWEMDISKLSISETAFQALKQGDDLSILVGAESTGRGVAGRLDGGLQNNWFQLRQWEVSEGFITWYDAAAGGAVIINNNPDSKYYGYFCTYESQESLAARLDYLNQEDLGGLIVWASSGDHVASGNPMISQMSVGLGITSAPVTPYNPTDDEKDTGVYEPNYSPIKEWYEGMPRMSAGQVFLYDGALWLTAKDSVSTDATPDTQPNYFTKLGNLYDWEKDAIEGWWDSTLDRGPILLETGDYLVYEGNLYRANGAGSPFLTGGYEPNGAAAFTYDSIGAYTFEAAPQYIIDPIYEWYVGMTGIKARQVVLSDGALWVVIKDGASAVDTSWKPANKPEYYEKLANKVYFWEKDAGTWATAPKLDLGDCLIYNNTVYQCTDDSEPWLVIGWGEPVGWVLNMYQNLGSYNLVAAPSDVTITFSAGSGNGSYKSLTKQAGSTLTITKACANAFSRKKYVFAYFTDQNGSKYYAGNKYTVNSDLTLTARYTRVTVGTAAKPRLSVSGSKIRVRYDKVTSAAGYQFTVSTSSSFAAGKGGSKAYKGYTPNYIQTCAGKSLKKGTTYYVKVRAYKLDSTGAKVYGSYSLVAKLKF